MLRGSGRERWRRMQGSLWSVCVHFKVEILQEVLEQNLGCLSFDCELCEGGNWHEPFSHWVAGRL